MSSARPLKLTRVYTSSSSAQAQLICNRLNDAGIIAKMVGASLPYIGAGNAGSCEVWIDQEQLPEARKVLGIEPVEPDNSFTKPFQFQLWHLLTITSVVAIIGGLSVSPQHFQIVWTVLWIAFMIVVTIQLQIRKRKSKLSTSSGSDSQSLLRP